MPTIPIELISVDETLRELLCLPRKTQLQLQKFAICVPRVHEYIVKYLKKAYTRPNQNHRGHHHKFGVVV